MKSQSLGPFELLGLCNAIIGNVVTKSGEIIDTNLSKGGDLLEVTLDTGVILMNGNRNYALAYTADSETHYTKRQHVLEAAKSVKVIPLPDVEE